MPPTVKLRTLIRERLGGIGERALNKRIAKTMSVHPTATREEALLVIAADSGINISSHTDSESSLDRVRAMRGGRGNGAAQPVVRQVRNKASRTRHVVIAGGVELSDPILPAKVIEEAKMMAEKVYPKLYVLENSVREVISRVLRSVHGQGWWGSAAPAGVKKTVAVRKQAEDNKRWHGKRGAHEIYYTDVDELKSIVNVNYQHFKAIFPDPTWFNHILDVVVPSRNVCSHHNPVTADDVKRIDVYFRDWQKHIDASRDLVP